MSPHEGPTTYRFSLRRSMGPRKFVAASLVIDILSPDHFREEIPFPWYGRRGLLARGAYNWPQGEALAPVASPLATPLTQAILSSL